ncbi:Fur family transcriptional regulator [Aquimarina sp. 2201CG5-10]|uniref:Fur family transcriptional regulator n=1 Tax=Aquimarina callyspongiae TaxID=3098150 RepID=UPI002AB3CC13|nr:transcriptional repressor [Aquimarina sp. 2201CG5-10]MDY8134621.1 transcriptional repressor [Aquimarina sp. 2201CG5-10]
MIKIEMQLKKLGIRPTAMRILIFQFIEAQTSAVSLTAVENHFEKSDRTTLYRTLKTFEEKGVVHQIDDGTGIPKYALCTHEHQSKKHNDLHLHFHCLKCCNTVCLTNHQIPQITLPVNFIPENINMLVKGICDKCNNYSK